MFIKKIFESKFIIPSFIQTLPNIENHKSKIWTASFKLDRDVRSLFAYINSTLDDALFYEKPEHLRFLFNGYRCILYPETVVAYFFETRGTARIFISDLINFLNNIHERKTDIVPNFEQIRKVPVVDLLKILPGTNCKDCGYPTCMSFAAAINIGKTSIDMCPHLDAPVSENVVYPVIDDSGSLVSSLSLPVCKSGSKQELPKKNFHLTSREIEVLELIAQGYTNNEISGVLFISPHTVKSHMINIFNKLNVNDRTRAAVIATRNRII